MSRRQSIAARLVQARLIAVVRVADRSQLQPLTEALVAGGIKAIEVTMTTPDALAAIKQAREQLPAEVLVGVGTVLDANTCRAAITQGAEFVVSPILRPAVAEAAQAEDCPVMLGAYTPTEAQLAFEAGSDFVKLFPADTLGPAYVKALLAPLPHLRLIPTGIAKREQIPEFIKAGCVALGLGSLLMPREALQKSDWKSITAGARELLSLSAA